MKKDLFGDFIENHCRLCPKVFCCKSCREKHEYLHEVEMTDCSLCIQGVVKISLIKGGMLSHIKKHHLPLHCVKCSVVFSATEELFQSHGCSVVAYSKSSISMDNNYQSPPCVGTKEQCNLATSTPMQNDGKPNLALKKIQEAITPVEYSGSKDSILKKGHHSERGDLTNRKVTFSSPADDTDEAKKASKIDVVIDLCESSDYAPVVQITENYQASSNTSIPEHASLKLLKESPVVEENSPFLTARVSSDQIDIYDQSSNDLPSGLKLSKYYSAQDFSQYWQSVFNQVTMNSSTTSYRDTPKLPGHKKIDVNAEREVLLEEKTLWISAVTTSISRNISQLNTPMASTSKTPTSTLFEPTENEQLNAIKKTVSKYVVPIQISSTPNSSIIPVRSIPRAQDIFRGESSNFDTGLEYQDKENSNPDPTNTSRIKNTWTSVVNIMKTIADFRIIPAAGGAFGSRTSTSRKRLSSDNSLDENHPSKRYKLTDIKCRPSIRGLPRPREDPNGDLRINIIESITRTTIAKDNRKTFADKSTQTDDFLYIVR